MLNLIFGLLLALDPRLPSKKNALVYFLSLGVKTFAWAYALRWWEYFVLPDYTGPLGGRLIIIVLLVASIRFLAISILLRDENTLEEDRRIFFGESRAGFTLIEVLVVIAIIGILVGLLLPVIQAAMKPSGSIDTEVSIGGIFLLSLINIIMLFVDYRTLVAFGEYSPKKGAVHTGIGAVAVSILIVLGTWANGLAVWRPAYYASLLGNGKVEQVSWESTIEAPSEESMRSISPEQSAWKMKQALTGTYGTLFHRSRMFHIKVQQKGYWIAETDYNKPGSVWFQKLLGKEVRYPNGYLICSSENPNEEAKLIEEINGKPISLKYTPKAWHGDNLYRHVYEKWPELSQYRRGQWAFELDDDWMPKYVISLVRPTVSFQAPVIEKYAIFDPQTDELEIYEKEALPIWVDNPMPTELLDSYIEYWGKYPKSVGDGFWDHFLNFSGTDIVQAGSREHRMTWNEEGSPRVFTSITSRSAADNSTKSYLFVNPRDGYAYECESDGQTETAAIQAVDAKVVFQKRHGTAPIMFNVYGERAWVVPVSGMNNAPEGIAIVGRHANARSCVVGETKAEALRLWKQYLAGSDIDVVPTANSNVLDVLGTIEVHEIADQNGNSSVYIRLKENPSEVYIVGTDAVGFEKAVVSKEGEAINMKVLEFKDGRTSVSEFVNDQMK